MVDYATICKFHLVVAIVLNISCKLTPVIHYEVHIEKNVTHRNHELVISESNGTYIHKIMNQ